MTTTEQALIACLLMDARAIRTAADIVHPADFNDMRIGEIFRGVLGMRSAGEVVDVLTVSERLPDWTGNLQGTAAIHPAELHTWMDAPSTWVAVTGYAETVRRDAMRRGIERVADTLRQGVPTTDLASVVHSGISELRDLVESHAIRKLDAVPLGSILEGSVEYDWAIPGLLEKRDRVLITGVEGGGKTTLVRQLAICAAAGLHPFDFTPMTPARVLVIDAENSEVQWRRSVQRLVTIGKARGSVDPAEAVMIRCTSRLDLSREQDLSQVQALVDLHRPDVLFIGPLYRLVPRAINSDDDAAPLLAALDTLRERGAALVMEAHAGHALGAGGERDLRPRGSSALLGWPEFGLGLRPQRDSDGRSSDAVALVRWRGDRDARDWPEMLRRGHDWPWVPMEDEMEGIAKWRR